MAEGRSDGVVCDMCGSCKCVEGGGGGEGWEMEEGRDRVNGRRGNKVVRVDGFKSRY